MIYIRIDSKIFYSNIYIYIYIYILYGDIDYFDTVAGVLQGDTLAPYLFIISLVYILRMSIDLMKENGFKLVKERSRRYPAQTFGPGLCS